MYISIFIYFSRQIFYINIIQMEQNENRKELFSLKTIVFEGGEGSGKGTVIDNLERYLKNNGYSVIRTREPGGSKINEDIRSIIVGEQNTNMCALTEVCLFAACRAQLLEEVVRPAINSNAADFMLIDRYVYSSYAYQGFGRGVGYDVVKGINDVATSGWHPDAVVYLDMDPQKALERIAKNNRETNRLDKESLDFYNKVREGYHAISSEFGFIVVNADDSPDGVLHNVIDNLGDIIGKI
jgi:dTMP kinase